MIVIFERFRDLKKVEKHCLRETFRALHFMYFHKNLPWLVNRNLKLKIAKYYNIFLSQYCVQKYRVWHEPNLSLSLLSLSLHQILSIYLSSHLSPSFLSCSFEWWYHDRQNFHALMNWPRQTPDGSNPMQTSLPWL